MPKICITGQEGTDLIKSMRRNVIIAGQSVVVDSRSDKGTFLSIKSSALDTIWEFGPDVEIGETTVDSSPLPKCQITMGQFFAWSFGGTGAATYDVSIDGTPIVFDGSTTVLTSDPPDGNWIFIPCDVTVSAGSVATMHAIFNSGWNCILLGHLL